MTDIVDELREAEGDPYIPGHAWRMLRDAAAEIERLRGEVEWDHRGIPIYEDGSEAVGRSIDACRELVEADANPDHWINKERNYDLPAFVAFRTERRRRGTDGPWEPTPEGEADDYS